MGPVAIGKCQIRSWFEYPLIIRSSSSSRLFLPLYILATSLLERKIVGHGREDIPGVGH